MKRRFIAVVIGLLTLSWACSDDDNNEIPVIEPEAQGVFKGTVEYEEEELEIEFPWVRYGNLEWMTTNLNTNIRLDKWKSNGCAISYEFNRNPIDQEIEIEQNYKTFGCLYTYEKALALCPQGWRIPTDEDWQALEKAMGMSNADLNATDWRGNPVGTLLQQEEGTMLNLRPGGTSNDGFDFYFTYVYGFYWTATPETEGSNLHYCRQISYNSGQIARTTIDKSKYLSVRYVRDVQNN